MFKRFECGCVGFVTRGMETDPHNKRAFVFKSCDGDGLRIYEHSSLAIRPSVKLTDDEIEHLLLEVAPLVARGNALDDLQTALKAAGLKTALKAAGLA